MNSRTALLARFLMAAAFVIGGGSLVLFGVFLFRGPFRFFTFDSSFVAALGIDATLCLLFFIQHSVMVRKSFHDRLSSVVPSCFHRAVYAVASGVVLLALMVFWQPTPILFSIQGIFRLLLRGAFLGSFFGFFWSVNALGDFDALGIQPIKARLRNRELPAAKFAVKGSYKLVRHPVYLFTLVLLWCYPDISPDRLLLNIAFSIWIVVGTVLEERDLVAEFGQEYIEYQKNVPMLLPWRRPKVG